MASTAPTKQRTRAESRSRSQNSKSRKTPSPQLFPPDSIQKPSKVKGDIQIGPVVIPPTPIKQGYAYRFLPALERQSNNNGIEISSSKGKKRSLKFRRPEQTIPASAIHQSSSTLICSQCKDDDNSPINLVRRKIIRKIFGYLSHTDILTCRLVQKPWNNFISAWDSFLEKTVYVVVVHKSYNYDYDVVQYHDVIQHANLPFKSARLQYLDHHCLREPDFFSYSNSDNERYFPNMYFLRFLVSFELRRCFILWSNLKKILAQTVTLQELIIDSSYISEDYHTQAFEVSESDDSAAATTLAGLRKLEINETSWVGNISKLLYKMNTYFAEKLTSLKIRYCPPANRPEHLDDAKPNCMELAHEVKRLIGNNIKTLTVLVLDIRHEHSLDMVAFAIVSDLEHFGKVLDLTEFQLSPCSNVWLHQPKKQPKQNVPMTMRLLENGRATIKSTASSLARFLESQQNLKTLCLPCIEYPEAFSSCFRFVLQKIPSRSVLKEMVVPCAGFLPQDFLRQFPRLERLRVGGSCCGDEKSAWETFNEYLNVKGQDETLDWNDPGDDANVLGNIKELSIFCVQPPSNFHLLSKHLSNLTHLEVNSESGRRVFKDEDMQACIKHLKLLTSLIIACADDLTDHGITGLPEYNCQLMFKLQRYHWQGMKSDVWDSDKVKGRPLSDLKGLKTLVLMGNNGFTDIGIGYALRFQELKYCHLPYSDNITPWGIETLGQQNPSLDTLVFTGISNLTKESFEKLRKTHTRLNRGDISRSVYFFERNSELEDDFSLVLPSPEEIFSNVISILIQNINLIKNYLSGVKYPEQKAISSGEIIEGPMSEISIQKKEGSRFSVHSQE